MAGLSAVLHKLVRHEDEQDREELRDESGRCGASSVEKCRDRKMHSFRGVLSSVTMPPRCDGPNFTAELFDGSGYVTLVWMGRRFIPGIRPGTRMHVSGRVMMKNGRPVIFNPTYDVLAPEGRDA